MGLTWETSPWPAPTDTVAAVAIGPMVPLTTAANPFAARVLAAHLGAEGIVWELRGNVDGPYPVGPVEVLVAQDDLDFAREVVTEVPASAVAQAADDAAIRARRSPRDLWVLLAIVLLMIAVLLGRLLTLSWH